MKMSDALRGAADSAPIAELHIETAGAAKRVRRTRAVRMGANGIVGVGAAALVVAGVMGALANQTGIVAAENNDGGSGRESDAGTAAIEPGPVPADDTMLACGYVFDPAVDPAGAVTSKAVLAEQAEDFVGLTLTYGSSDAAPVTLGVVTHHIVWEGIVVGFANGEGDIAWDPSAEPTATIDSSVKLFNCWDGAALPAGDYTVVTVTPVSAAPDSAPSVEEPSVDPMEPTLAPEGPAPSPTEPSTAPSDGDVSVSSDDGAVTDIAEAPATYAVTEPVAFTIAGDPVKDPFGKYLNPEPQPTPELPSDALTTDTARKAYEAALTGPWNMAAGSQRVVKTGDAAVSNNDLWSTTYFGCPTEGTSGRFPAESADLNWLGVDAALPGTLDVSYGWVVNGNPLIDLDITNNSEWSLPGFYAGSTPHLVLVRDGRVVAESWPVNPENNGGGGVIAYEANDGQAAAEDAKLIWAPADDYLAPGEELSGEFLWRDVSGCWTGDKQNDVSPGNYTVLAVQDVYLGGSYAVLEGDPAASARDTGNADVDEPALVAPNPGLDDYVSFQVWTSLGDLRVTN